MASFVSSEPLAFDTQASGLSNHQITLQQVRLRFCLALRLSFDGILAGYPESGVSLFAVDSWRCRATCTLLDALSVARCGMLWPVWFRHSAPLPRSFDFPDHFRILAELAPSPCTLGDIAVWNFFELPTCLVFFFFFSFFFFEMCPIASLVFVAPNALGVI